MHLSANVIEWVSVTYVLGGDVNLSNQTQLLPVVETNEAVGANADQDAAKNTLGVKIGLECFDFFKFIEHFDL